MSFDLLSVLGILDCEIKYIFENEESFLERFCKGNIMDLIDVTFSSTNIKMVYVLESGQHIADSATIEAYQEWRSA